MQQLLVFDVGGTAIKYNLVTKSGDLVGPSLQVDTPKTLSAFVESINEIIEKYRDKNIVGLSFSMPGFVNYHKNTLAQAGALRYLENTNMNELFADNNLPITINNDARCVAIAEEAFGSAQGCENFACMTIGTGIGVGVVVRGQLLAGSAYRAGEFGKSIIHRQDGEYFDYHQLASMSALIAAYTQLKGIDDTIVITGTQIFNEAETDDEVAAIIDKWYEYLAIAVFNLSVTFDCEKVLIGGGVSQREDLVERIAEKGLLIRPEDWQTYAPVIERCKYQNDSGILGAAAFFFQENAI